MSDELARLQRWVDSGGVVRVVARRGDEITVSLVTCVGDEEMDRLVTRDPAAHKWCAQYADDPG